MPEKLTIEEFKALLEFAWDAGVKSGTYRNSSPGYRQDIKLKGYYFLFEDWYKENVGYKNNNNA